jgi:CHAD domain-containing protein
MTPRRPSDPWAAAARALREAWPGVVVGDAPAVHRARVATRRLREALPLLGAGRPRALRRLRRDLRSLTRALGPVRELDVTLGLVVRLLHDEPELDVALETIRVRLMERRQRRRKRLLRQVDPADVAGILARVRSLAAGAPAGRPRATVDRGALRRRIAARADDLGRAIDGAGALYAPEALHRVRIAAKKLRYSLELGRAARLAGAARAATRLRRTQDLLGEWHDWQILASHASRVQGATDPGDLRLADFTALATRVEDRCRALHADFMREREDLSALADGLAAEPRPARASTREP